MYLKEKMIRFLKIRNVIFAVISIFNIITSTSILISLTKYYWGDFDTVIHAKATPSCVADIIIGIILLVISQKSKRRIQDANFYSGYFEGNLDGYIEYSELAEVTGQTEKKVKKQLSSLSRFYMKNYELKTIDGTEQIALSSKKYTCECKSCGAQIEKSIYFTGVCAYCGSSDLFANVLTNDRFYIITNSLSDCIQKPQYYSAKNLNRKKVFFILLLALGIFTTILFSAMFMDYMGKYNDKEYLTKVLLSDIHASSFANIKADLAEMMIWDVIIIAAFIPIIRNRIKKIKHLHVAQICSEYFSKCRIPFINASDIPSANMLQDKNTKLEKVRTALRYGYLKNSTLEKHNDKLVIALAKKIVKDRCPSCAAPITGAVDEHYRCQYCNNMIMNVIIKK